MEWLGLLLILLLCISPYILIRTAPPGRWVGGQWQSNAQMRQNALRENSKHYIPEPVQTSSPRSTKSKTWIPDKPSVVIVEPFQPSDSVEWFVGEWGINAPSPAEQLIMNELKKYNAKWYREVSFRNFVSPSGGFPRFDFYLPDQRCVIEYDSKKWHNSIDRLENDTIKSNFCRNNGIKLIRLNSKHYYKMPQTIYDIIKEFATMDWE